MSRRELPPAYWQGLDARCDGLPLEANPYDRQTQERLWTWWRRGWFACC
ncbi:MAG: hypothetical protein IT429_14865 [Gemmataceae bacterium]|nr:hypothetical protein [Gemmataceae bacterium]